MRTFGGPAIFLCSALLVGCIEPELELASTQDGPTFEEWLATKRQLTNGKYVVQGDIFTDDIELLQAMYAQEVPNGQALAVHTNAGFRDIWSPTQKVNITYCIATDHFTSEQLGKLKPALEEAMIGWESAANVNFVHVTSQDGAGCRPSNTNVQFDVRFYSCSLDPGFGSCADYCDGNPNCKACVTPGDPTCTPPFAAAAFFPSFPRSGGAGEGQGLVLGNANIFGNTAPNLEFTMRHELGHALGFIHEFGRNDVTLDPGGGSEACEESDDYQALTNPDLGSVMMYGPNQGCTTYNGVVIPQPVYYTESDLRGVRNAYGTTTFYQVVPPNIGESYAADGAAPGDYDGNGVTDLVIRSGRAGNLMIFFHPGATRTPPNPLLLPWSVVSHGYGTGGQVMPGKYHDSHYTDIAIKDDTTGTIYIDYGFNGIQGWDVSYGGYGYADARVAPADYDGDGLTDLSVKDQNGNWFIDYSSMSNTGGICGLPPCFGTWNDVFFRYGDNALVLVPVDHDGDRRADIAVKGSNGQWSIDFSNDCFRVRNGVWLPCFGQWNLYRYAYGDSSAYPIPADYNGDGHADLAIRTWDGYFAVDYWDPSYPHYHGWDIWPIPGYGDSNWTPIPGKYHGPSADKQIDMAHKRRQNATVELEMYVDFSSNGLGVVDHTILLQQ